MLCTNCKKDPANIHFKSLLNGQVTQWDLCAGCAQKKGLLKASSESFPWIQTPFESLSELIAQLADAPAAGGKRRPEPRCSHCGLTYGEFRVQGRFGCAHCYAAFQPQVAALLPQIHGQSRHTGKTYAAPRGAMDAPAGGGPVKEQQIDLLTRQLKEAVQKEDFERAAHLRDELRRLKHT